MLRMSYAQDELLWSLFVRRPSVLTKWWLCDCFFFFVFVFVFLFFAESDYMWPFLFKWQSLKKLFVVYAEIYWKEKETQGKFYS